MFIVIATHNTGHGEASTPVLATKSIRKAVKTARGIEGLGYEFYSDEIGVGVYRLEAGHPYRKEEFKWHLGENPPPTIVFYREHCKKHDAYHLNDPIDGSCWKEEWFDRKLQSLADETRS